jgi:hypothetical protein
VSRHLLNLRLCSDSFSRTQAEQGL